MNTRVDGLNRVVLAVIGLVLLAAGGLGIATGAGAFSGSSGRLLPTGVRSFARTSSWFWWVVAAGALVVALLALRWLIDQLRTDRAGSLDLTTDDKDGVTTVHSGALTDAVADEAEAVRGVTRASAQLRDRRGRRLLLAVDLADHADIAAVRQALEGHVVAHARQAVDDPALPVEIELRQGRASAGDRGLR
jgi:hypothetical protein